jgi:hypothetical protein
VYHCYSFIEKTRKPELVTSALNFRLGNYVALERLYQYLPEARAAKAHLGKRIKYLSETVSSSGQFSNSMIHKSDHVIDLCGEPVTGGTGLQNLRECIQWAEQKFNFEPKLKKVSEIQNFFFTET